MYFITNDSNYIVASSKKFLKAVGASDICNLSNAIKDERVLIKSNESTLTVNNKTSYYTTTDISSVLGNLKLYKLSDTNSSSSNREDDNIEYLKKIKEGTIKKRDFNYDIPDISKKEITEDVDKSTLPELHLQDEITAEEKSTTSTTEDLLLKELEDINPKDEVTLEHKPKTQELHLDETQETEKVTVKYYDIIDDKIITEDEVVDNKVTKESQDLIESIKNIENSKDSANLQDTTPEDITLSLENSGKEVDEIVSLTSHEDINSDLKKSNKSDDISDELEILMDDKEKREKKGGLKLSKLFPWGSKKSKDSDLDLITSNTDITLEEQELEILRETTSKKEDMEKLASSNVTNILEEQTTQSDDIENSKQKSHIFSQLTTKQIDNINFSDNANKLSIDEDSYRLLLDNYLDELDNYENELKKADKATVEMMSDASSLLSLDIITKKLDSITKLENKEEVVKEINLIKSLLKNKLNKSINYDTIKSREDEIDQIKTTQTPKLNSEIEDQIRSITNIEEKRTTEDKKPPIIPTKAIDIDSAEQLLQVIESINIDFDLEKPSSELNLPKPLILEFINDFITQSKEHLPVLVEAYKKRDIKTIKTTGHMLKGAASNLRLDSMSKTLYKMQKEDNIEVSGENIKEFVASLKGLKRTIEQIESSDNEN